MTVSRCIAVCLRLGLVLVPLCVSIAAQGLTPKYVVDLREAIKAGVLRVDLSITGVSNSNGRWAVLTEFKNRQSLVLTGDSRVDGLSPILEDAFDQIGIDAAHNIYLQKRSGPEAASTEIVEWNRTNGKFSSIKVDSPRATPFLSNGAVLWKTPRGVVQIDGDALEKSKFKAFRTVIEPLLSLDSTGKTVDQQEFILGLPNGRHAVLGNLTEEIRVYDADGSLLSSAFADLTGAFASIGHFVAKYDPAKGRSRMVWASSSADGNIYIRLSVLKFLGPAVLAVINPDTGSLIKTITLNLPTIERKKGPDNPEGVPFFAQGSVTDQLVVVDTAAMVLAVYEP